MSLNKYMHPRNPFFNNPPDFTKLAQLYPEFEKFCQIKKNKADVNQKFLIDFKNPEALKAVCVVLMKHLFGLNIHLPLNHLIPRVPQRLNYVLWIEDLLEKPNKAIGIDIGCGASCIFGILACCLNKEWKMIGSDITDENVEWANKNITENNLQDKISNLISLIDENEENKFSKHDIDFVMCNPPFFENEAEHFGVSEVRNPVKRPAPKSINTAKFHESIYDDGGEVGFLKKIIDESVKLNKRIKIYTSMLGKKKSLVELKKYLIVEKKILNISETQFCQGHTMRWGIAWSFSDDKLFQFDFMKSSKEKQTKQLKLEINSSLIPCCDKPNLHKYIKNLLINHLEFEQTQDNEENSSMTFNIQKKTWTGRQRAQKRRQLLENSGIDLGKPNFPNVESNFKICFTIEEIEKKIFLHLKLVDFAECSAEDLIKNKNYLNEIFHYIERYLNQTDVY